MGNRVACVISDIDKSKTRNTRDTIEMPHMWLDQHVSCLGKKGCASPGEDCRQPKKTSMKVEAVGMNKVVDANCSA